MKKQLNIKNKGAIKFVSKEIARSINRGYAIRDKAKTILRFLRYELGVKNLSKLNETHKEAFIEHLKSGNYARHTTATSVSVWNRIVEYAEKPELRISAKEHDLSKGSFEYTNRAASREAHESFTKWLQDRYEKTGDIRYEALRHSVELQRSFGLRASESFAIKVTSKDISEGRLHLDRSDDTKNGRPRDIPVWNQEQVRAFTAAKAFTESHGWYSLIPPESTKAEYQNFAYHTLAEFKHEHPEYKNYSFHAERHAFAQEFYSHLVEQKHEQKQRDEADTRLDAAMRELTREEEIEIRRQVSEALGHNRDEVTAVYVGK